MTEWGSSNVPVSFDCSDYVAKKDLCLKIRGGLTGHGSEVKH